MVMGPVVDRDLLEFQHTLAVNLVQMLAEVLLASFSSVYSKVIYADGLHLYAVWLDNQQDFLGLAGSKK